MKEIYDEDYFKESEEYEKHSAKMKTVRRNILKLAGDSESIKVLDVGCGSGFLVRNLNNLSNKLGFDAVGLDFSEHAGKQISNNFILHDVTEGIPFPDNSFDVVTALDFFEHLKEEDIDFVYEEMLRVGGEILAVISIKKNVGHLTIKKRAWWENKLPKVNILWKL